MKKRYLAIAMGIFMSAASIFAGCGNTAETEEASASASAGTASAAVSVAETEETEETAEDADSMEMDGGQMPDMPEGEGPGGEMPAMPEGEGPGGEMPAMPEGEGPGGEMPARPEGQMGGMGGQSAADISYTAVQEISSDTALEGESVASTGTDEEAVLVTDGAEAVLKSMTISRDSDDSTGGDNSSFYGVGAAVLATDGTAYVSDSTITTDAAGGAGAFAYGDGTVYIADTVIETSQDTSGGIHAAGGGTLYAWNVTATTEGESSAAIRSDRGGGTMVVDGGTYTSKGTGSPAIYSTADITVSGAELVSENSEAICIEGLNSVRLYDCDLTGNMPDQSQNDCTWNVILYQSMSGDSEVGNSTFQMSGGTLTAGNGGMFYTTNTESTFVLENVDIAYAEENDFFLKCTGNANERGWGSTGSNGADCSFTAIDQAMEGDILWDSISTLDFYMTGESTLTGAVINDESCAGEGGDGYCSLYIESGSTWIVTADSTLTSLYAEGTITDAEGNTVSIVDTDGTVYVEGTSQYTVTVENWSDSADTSSASTVSDWEEYAVEKPAQLD